MKSNAIFYINIELQLRTLDFARLTVFFATRSIF